MPISILTIVLAPQFSHVPRTTISTTAESTKPFDMPMADVALNMVPIVIFAALLALGLRLVTDAMVRAFRHDS